MVSFLYNSQKHKSSKTTEIYISVNTKYLGRFISPLDRLNLNQK